MVTFLCADAALNDKSKEKSITDANIHSAKIETKIDP